MLVVDDDPAMQLLMCETLIGAGFEVATAESGAEAIRLCTDFEPDLALLDINMPVMDGITACAEIKRVARRDFPVIMVTSVDDAVSIQRAFDAGANDFILKPVNWPLFQRRLDSVLADWQRSHSLDEHARRARMLARVAPEQVMLVSRSGLVIEDLKHRPDASLPQEEPPVRKLDDLFGTDVGQRLKQRISGVLKTRRHNHLEFSVAERDVKRHYEAQFLIDGRERVIVVIQNVDDEKHTQGEMYDLAFRDPVTDLPNRNLFERFMRQVMVDADLHDHPLVFINLRLEDAANDILADRRVMQAASRRIRDCVMHEPGVVRIGETESASGVAHIDANRFVVALRGADDSGGIQEFCGRLVTSLAEPLCAATARISLSPRLGVATYPSDGPDLETVLRAADAAAYEARETGEVLCFSSDAATAQNVSTLDYSNELRQALDEGQLELCFQPRFAMPERRITSVEALLRWNHPMRGYVAISELLHLAQATGLIVPLGNWVLHGACGKAQGWQGAAPPKISVNLSLQEFTRQDLADRVIEALETTGLEPHRIELELTEAALLRARDGLADLEKLKALGVGLVLDDFGTGHTSLASLKRFPIDALKIDRSFVSNLPHDESDAAVCEVIITMAHKLNMKVVAEGVETREQLEFLGEWGCDEFQGFYLCEPLSAMEIDTYLQSGSGPDS